MTHLRKPRDVCSSLSVGGNVLSVMHKHRCAVNVQPMYWSACWFKAPVKHLLEDLSIIIDAPTPTSPHFSLFPGSSEETFHEPVTFDPFYTHPSIQEAFLKKIMINRTFSTLATQEIHTSLSDVCSWRNDLLVNRNTTTRSRSFNKNSGPTLKPNGLKLKHTR